MNPNTTATKLFVGCDHAAFHAKEALKTFFPLVDLGAHSDASCDYPDYARLVARAVQKEGRGLLLCASGIGMSMAANRYRGIRAALCRTPGEAVLSVEHNDSNILCLGARATGPEQMKTIVEAWLKAEFRGGRHLRRIEKFHGLGEPPNFV